VRGGSRVRLDSSLAYIGAACPDRVEEAHCCCELLTVRRAAPLILWFLRARGRGWKDLL
jgi:hypothetical protein